MSPQSTHDWTSTPPSPGPNPELFIVEDLNEMWADTKSPREDGGVGEGHTYSVGTVEIRDTTEWGQPVQGPEFSNVEVGVPPDIIGPPDALAQFRLPVTGTVAMPVVPTRQVVILQCVDRFGGIVWQRYFYGGSPAVEFARYRCATNARAISVWAGATPADTRIAICGEQNDDILPLSQAAAGWLVSPATMVPRPFSGFIAVYDGFGTLLWTHHFFGSRPADLLSQSLDCAITDVSIRVVGTGEQRRDVVTYCGISELGNPVGGNAELTPVLPFLQSGAGLSDGVTDYGAANGRFDGMVGRLSRSQVNYATGTTVTQFHSVVGGSGSDGLFGIAELEDERFVVVGSTTQEEPAALGFPFTLTAGPPSGTFHRVGTLLGFNALPTETGGNLVLEFAAPLGTRGEHAAPIPAGTGKNSIARDVIVHLDGAVPGQHAIDVVGATDDPDFFGAMAQLGLPVSLPMSTFDLGATPAGSVPPSEGFFVGLWMSTAGGYTFTTPRLGGFVGGPGIDGLTGVAAWNEYPDQVHFSGYTRPSAGSADADILVASLVTSLLVGGASPDPTVLTRRTQLGGGAADLPAVMGPRSIQFETGLGPTDSHGSHAGGGIAVDPRARVTVVGATTSVDYPLTNAAFQPLYGLPRPNQIPAAGSVRDAVRTEFDMLPVGVGRTDGTGSMMGPVPAPQPPVGVTGGSTPVAALSPFGRRVGEDPLLRRTLVDFLGDNVFGAEPTIVFTRPSTNAVVLGTVLQFGFPVANPVTIDGVDFWLFDPSAVMFLNLWSPTPSSWRFVFTNTLGSVSGTTEISAQLISLIVCDPTTWAGSVCALNPTFGTDMTLVGSPALYFQFLNLLTPTGP